MSPHLDVGFYGKLPSHGDFLRRRASDAFVATWDPWLQDGLAQTRAELGGGWLDVYLTSPVWRFVCAAGACGPSAVAGVMVPSVDRVGRYFPLTIVGEIPAEASVVGVGTAGGPFFDAAERLVIETLESEPIDFEEFDEQVMRLSDLLSPACAPPGPVLDATAADVLEPGALACQVPIGSAPTARCRPQPDACPSTGGCVSTARALVDRRVVDGGAELPALERTAIPGGLRRDARRRVGASAVARDSVAERARAGGPTAEALVPEAPPIVFHSSAASDVGRLRSVNQDAFLERTEVGIWVVADGLGGHADGEIASRMVCDAFADLVPAASFDELIETAAERMHQVNDQLIRAAARSLEGVRCGSTVAALLVRGDRLAILWAGDSRVYRWRESELTQLTHDHSLAESEALVGGETSNVVTRAVGGDDALELDVYRDRVRPGDRFLLCSDGLTRNVPHLRIGEWMANPALAETVRGLIAATLDAGAPDNVTVLVVEAGV